MLGNGDFMPCVPDGLDFLPLTRRTGLGAVPAITEYELFTGTTPTPGGLYDPRLGSLGSLAMCTTCPPGTTSTQCPGHLGRIDLPQYIFTPFTKYTTPCSLLAMCRAVCYRCGNLVIWTPELSDVFTSLHANLVNPLFLEKRREPTVAEAQEFVTKAVCALVDVDTDPDLTNEHRGAVKQLLRGEITREALMLGAQATFDQHEAVRVAEAKELRRTQAAEKMRGTKRGRRRANSEDGEDEAGDEENDGDDDDEEDEGNADSSDDNVDVEDDVPRRPKVRSKQLAIKGGPASRRRIIDDDDDDDDETGIAPGVPPGAAVQQPLISALVSTRNLKRKPKAPARKRRIPAPLELVSAPPAIPGPPNPTTTRDPRLVFAFKDMPTLVVCQEAARASTRFLALQTCANTLVSALFTASDRPMSERRASIKAVTAELVSNRRTCAFCSTPEYTTVLPWYYLVGNKTRVGARFPVSERDKLDGASLEMGSDPRFVHMLVEPLAFLRRWLSVEDLHLLYLLEATQTATDSLPSAADRDYGTGPSGVDTRDMPEGLVTKEDQQFLLFRATIVEHYRAHLLGLLSELDLQVDSTQAGMTFSDFVTDAIPVTPPCMRPSFIVDDRYVPHAVTALYRHIIGQCKRLEKFIDMLDATEDGTGNDSVMGTITKLLYDTGNGAGGYSAVGLIPAVDMVLFKPKAGHTGPPSKDVGNFCATGRHLSAMLNSKHGLVAGMTSKRGTNRARAVIYADPYLPVGAAGIPGAIAAVLTVDVHVNSRNLAECQRWLDAGVATAWDIVNGPGAVSVRWPGDTRFKFTESYHASRTRPVSAVPPAEQSLACRGTSQFDYTATTSRRQPGTRPEPRALCIGAVVRRQLRAGDMVVIARQPSLHEYNHEAAAAVITTGNAVGLHPGIFTALAGDCDGDCVTIYTFGDEPTIAEGKGLMTMAATGNNTGTSSFMVNAPLTLGVAAFQMTSPGALFDERFVHDTLDVVFAAAQDDAILGTAPAYEMSARFEITASGVQTDKTDSARRHRSLASRGANDAVGTATAPRPTVAVTVGGLLDAALAREATTWHAAHRRFVAAHGLDDGDAVVTTNVHLGKAAFYAFRATQLRALCDVATAWNTATATGALEFSVPTPFPWCTATRTASSIPADPPVGTDAVAAHARLQWAADIAAHVTAVSAQWPRLRVAWMQANPAISAGRLFPVTLTLPTPVNVRVALDAASATWAQFPATPFQRTVATWAASQGLAIPFQTPFPLSPAIASPVALARGTVLPLWSGHVIIETCLRAPMRTALTYPLALEHGARWHPGGDFSILRGAVIGGTIKKRDLEIQINSLASTVSKAFGTDCALQLMTDLTRAWTHASKTLCHSLNAGDFLELAEDPRLRGVPLPHPAAAWKRAAQVALSRGRLPSGAECLALAHADFAAYATGAVETLEAVVGALPLSNGISVTRHGKGTAAQLRATCMAGVLEATEAKSRWTALGLNGRHTVYQAFSATAHTHTTSSLVASSMLHGFGAEEYYNHARHGRKTMTLTQDAVPESGTGQKRACAALQKAVATYGGLVVQETRPGHSDVLSFFFGGHGLNGGTITIAPFPPPPISSVGGDEHTPPGRWTALAETLAQQAYAWLTVNTWVKGKGSPANLRLPVPLAGILTAAVDARRPRVRPQSVATLSAEDVDDHAKRFLGCVQIACRTLTTMLFNDVVTEQTEFDATATPLPTGLKGSWSPRALAQRGIAGVFPCYILATLTPWVALTRFALWDTDVMTAALDAVIAAVAKTALITPGDAVGIAASLTMNEGNTQSIMREFSKVDAISGTMLGVSPMAHMAYASRPMDAASSARRSRKSTMTITVPADRGVDATTAADAVFRITASVTLGSLFDNVFEVSRHGVDATTPPAALLDHLSFTWNVPAEVVRQAWAPAFARMHARISVATDAAAAVSLCDCPTLACTDVTHWRVAPPTPGVDLGNSVPVVWITTLSRLRMEGYLTSVSHDPEKLVDVVQQTLFTRTSVLADAVYTSFEVHNHVLGAADTCIAMVVFMDTAHPFEKAKLAKARDTAATKRAKALAKASTSTAKQASRKRARVSQDDQIGDEVGSAVVQPQPATEATALPGEVATILAELETQERDEATAAATGAVNAPRDDDDDDDDGTGSAGVSTNPANADAGEDDTTLSKGPLLTGAGSALGKSAIRVDAASRSRMLPAVATVIAEARRFRLSGLANVSGVGDVTATPTTVSVCTHGSNLAALLARTIPMAEDATGKAVVPIGDFYADKRRLLDTLDMNRVTSSNMYEVEAVLGVEAAFQCAAAAMATAFSAMDHQYTVFMLDFMTFTGAMEPLKPEVSAASACLQVAIQGNATKTLLNAAANGAKEPCLAAYSQCALGMPLRAGTGLVHLIPNLSAMERWQRDDIRGPAATRFTTLVNNAATQEHGVTPKVATPHLTPVAMDGYSPSPGAQFSPAYLTPVCQGFSDAWAPTSPLSGPMSPTLLMSPSLTSPAYEPVSPAYAPTSPGSVNPTSPAYLPISPVYAPTSPGKDGPTSPAYSPGAASNDLLAMAIVYDDTLMANTSPLVHPQSLSPTFDGDKLVASRRTANPFSM